MKDGYTYNLISSLLNYIDLMEEELGELVPLAHQRGWRSSRIETGNEARKEIQEAQEKLVQSLGITESEIALALKLSKRQFIAF